MDNRKRFTREEIEHAVRSSGSMGGAAKLLRIHWRTFKKCAEEFELYLPSKFYRQKLDLDDILAGKHPQYHTSHLAKRLVSSGRKEYRCEGCQLVDWRGEKISLELNHKDGDNSNHAFENLEFLCPNCHSQTDTYRNKRGKPLSPEKRQKLSSQIEQLEKEIERLKATPT